MKRLSNKIALVTGAGSGIGGQIVARFAQEGADIIAFGHRPGYREATEEAVAQYGRKVRYYAVDITRPKPLQEAINDAVKYFGRIDTLVANAGREQPTTAPLDDIPDEELHMIVDTNLKGTLLTVKYALPHISRPGGSICLVSSLWSLLGGVGLTVYTSTKGGINAMTRSLAVDYGPVGIRVNCISPGAIETPMLWRYTKEQGDMSGFYRANVPLQRSGTPEEVAEAILWISSPEAAYVTGQVLSVDGGITSKMSVSAP